MPTDKFSAEIILRDMEFLINLEKLLDGGSKFHWLDEKHMVNKDVEATKVRADPLNFTGYIPCIYVNGDFREAYNLFAIISASPRKASHVAYSVRTPLDEIMAMPHRSWHLSTFWGGRSCKFAIIQLAHIRVYLSPVTFFISI